MAAISQLDAAYQHIREKLARGEAEPGRKLSRRRLAEEIGVSPALVQHALAQLEKEGLVECRPQSGTYVRELTFDEFENLCDLRELIEPYAAARAATCITVPQLKILEKSCRRYRRWGLRCQKTNNQSELWQIRSKLVVEEQIFHGTILSAAGNSLLANLVSTLRLLGQVRPRLRVHLSTRNFIVALEHERIVAALQAHDTDRARQCMLEHIQGSRGVLQPNSEGELPRFLGLGHHRDTEGANSVEGRGG